MKNLIVIALMSLMTTSAFAFVAAGQQGGDQEYAQFTCNQVRFIPDATISLKVITGGIAGLTRLEITTGTIGGPRVHSVIVHALPATRTPSQLVYVGKDVTLKISSTQEDKQGNRPSVIKFGQGSDAQSFDMVCQQHFHAIHM